MGNKPAVNAIKAQADGSWIRRAFNGKGVAIVKSTEQAGKFTLTAPFRSLEIGPSHCLYR